MLRIRVRGKTPFAPDIIAFLFYQLWIQGASFWGQAESFVRSRREYDIMAIEDNMRSAHMIHVAYGLERGMRTWTVRR